MAPGPDPGGWAPPIVFGVRPGRWAVLTLRGLAERSGLGMRVPENDPARSYDDLRYKDREPSYRAKLAEAAGRAFDVEAAGRVDRAVARLDVEPMAALTLLESHAAGLDRLLASWAGLAEAVEGGPKAWNQMLYHHRLMVLL